MIETDWYRFSVLAIELGDYRLKLLADRANLVQLVRTALKEPRQREVAFELIYHMQAEEVQELLPLLLDLACFANRYINLAQLAIRALPRRWLMEHIGEPANKILAKLTGEEFGPLLRLLMEVHPEFGVEVARARLSDPDESIREIARAFLE